MDDKQARQRISENILDLMERRKVSRPQLARLSGTTEMTIGRIICRQNTPNVALVSRIAAALDVTVDVLLREPEKKPERILEKAQHPD